MWGMVLSSTLNPVLHHSIQYGGDSFQTGHSFRLSYSFFLCLSVGALQSFLSCSQLFKLSRTKKLCFASMSKHRSLLFCKWCSWDYLSSRLEGHTCQLFLETGAVAWGQVRATSWTADENIATCLQRWTSRIVIWKHPMLWRGGWGCGHCGF